MGTNIKDQVDALLALKEPHELAGISRGLEENGALRKAIEASIKYWNAWKDAQQQLIDLEDEKAEVAAAVARIAELEKRTRRAFQIATGAAVVTVGIVLGNLAALFL